MNHLSRLLFLLLSLGLLLSCQFDGNDNGMGASGMEGVETWAMLPFYGETRFLVVNEATNEPITGVTLQVDGLKIDTPSHTSDQEGRIIIHQLMRGITYRNEGPPPPSFTFSAPGYRSRTYSVEDLVSGTDYNPYNGSQLPTTIITTDEGADMELPIYEFTIRLQPND